MTLSHRLCAMLRCRVATIKEGTERITANHIKLNWLLLSWHSVTVHTQAEHQLPHTSIWVFNYFRTFFKIRKPIPQNWKQYQLMHFSRSFHPGAPGRKGLDFLYQIHLSVGNFAITLNFRPTLLINWRICHPLSFTIVTKLLADLFSGLCSGFPVKI